MKKKFWKGIVLGLASLCLFTGCGKNSTPSTSAPTPKKPVELRMNVTTADSSVWMACAREFKKQIEEKTGGRYKVAIYSNEQLSSGNQIKGVEMLLDGTTDVDMHSTMIIATFEPKLGALSMPWLFPRGYQDVDRIVFNGGPGGQMISQLMEAKGAHVLGLCENGFRQITNNKREIKTPEDMKGLKVRIASIPQYTTLYKMFGTDPVTMSFGEVFTALQQGAIDGQENPVNFIKAGNIQEVQKYMSMWNYAYDAIVLSVSNKVWDQLSEEDKAIFAEAGKEACAKQVAVSRAAEKKTRKEFEANGMKVTDLTPEEIAAFQACVAPIYDKYRAEFTDEVMNAFGYVYPDQKGAQHENP